MESVLCFLGYLLLDLEAAVTASGDSLGTGTAPDFDRDSSPCWTNWVRKNPVSGVRRENVFRSGGFRPSVSTSRSSSITNGSIRKSSESGR